MEPNIEFYFFHSDSMKQCLYVVLLKGRELRQWLIYFLSHTAASNHCSMELLTHPSIMLSRHIIYPSACPCALVCVHALVWFLGALKAGVEKARVGIRCANKCTFVLLRIWKLDAFVSELRPRRTPKCNTFSLQPVAQSHIINRRRSHSNVRVSPSPLGPEKQMKLSAWTRPQRHVSQLDESGSLCCNVFVWSVSMNVCNTLHICKSICLCWGKCFLHTKP